MENSDTAGPDDGAVPRGGDDEDDDDVVEGGASDRPTGRSEVVVVESAWVGW